MTNSSIFNSKEAGLFLSRLIGFITFSLSVITILSFLCYHTVIKVIKDSKYLKLPQHVNTLIMGDSHAMTGITPMERKEVLSCAKRAELIPLTFLKLKFITASNPQINKIIMNVGYHNFFNNRSSVLHDPETAPYYCDHYFQLYDAEMRVLAKTSNGSYLISWLKFVCGLPIEMSKNLSQFVRILLKSNDYSYYPFWGGFVEMNTPYEKLKINVSIERHFYRNAIKVQLSNIMIDYFERIIKYCNENGIRVYTVNTPLMPEYEMRVPESLKKDMEGMLELMKIKYKNLEYYNYSRMSLPDEYWLDSDHLNGLGASYFSKVLFKKIDDQKQGVDYDN